MLKVFLDHVVLPDTTRIGCLKELSCAAATSWCPTKLCTREEPESASFHHHFTFPWDYGRLLDEPGIYQIVHRTEVLVG
jgi:hypothetical protein